MPIPHGGTDNTINEPRCEINAVPCGDNDPLKPACGGIIATTHSHKVLGGKVLWKEHRNFINHIMLVWVGREVSCFVWAEKLTV